MVTLTLGLGACSPTYRQDQLIESIQGISAKEYRFKVSARRVGQTLAVHLDHQGILQQVGSQVGVAPSANEIIGNLIEVIHRVVLSSDSEIRFYVALISDPNVPGVFLTVIRDLDDVRRVNTSMIPPTEFLSRTVFDLRYAETASQSLEQLIPTDIRLEQFLAWQLTKRIQARLTNRFQLEGLGGADVGQCAGEFRNGEFVFTLNIAPKLGRQFTDDRIHQIFEEATGEIAQVLSGYHFKDFEAIRLIHPLTGRIVLLPKTRLDLFR